MLSGLFADHVSALNRDFLDKVATNLRMLFDLFLVKNTADKKDYVRAYYEYTVRKMHRNLGFSIKLLREHMTADIEEASVIRSQTYDSVRGKVNPKA